MRNDGISFRIPFANQFQARLNEQRVEGETLRVEDPESPEIGTEMWQFRAEFMPSGKTTKLRVRSYWLADNRIDELCEAMLGLLAGHLRSRRLPAEVPYY